MDKKVADLRSHEECQARLGLTKEAVTSYAAAYKAGKALPPLEVFEVDGELIVVDGFHRLEAAKQAEVATLPVEVVGKGTMAEAAWTALGKNHNHGVRRTREDKRKAVQVALGNEAAAKLSNRRLAKYLDVSHTFVAGERKLFEATRGNDAMARSPEHLAADVAFARKMLATEDGKGLASTCKRSAQLNERALESGDDDAGHSMPAHAQWIRVARLLNQNRHELEQQGHWFSAHLNLTHVAGVIAQAGGCEPDEGFFVRTADGFSVDHDIVYDDTRPDPLNHKDFIEELQQLAPHRCVLRLSEQSDQESARESSWPSRDTRGQELSEQEEQQLHDKTALYLGWVRPGKPRRRTK